MTVFCAEEGCRGVMLEPLSTESSALLLQNKGKKVGQGQIASSGNEVGGIDILKEIIKTPFGLPIVRSREHSRQVL